VSFVGPSDRGSQEFGISAALGPGRRSGQYHGPFAGCWFEQALPCTSRQLHSLASWLAPPMALRPDLPPAKGCPVGIHWRRDAASGPGACGRAEIAGNVRESTFESINLEPAISGSSILIVNPVRSLQVCWWLASCVCPYEDIQPWRGEGGQLANRRQGRLEEKTIPRTSKDNTCGTRQTETDPTSPRHTCTATRYSSRGTLSTTASTTSG
jgi:hypothetical protein